MRLRRIQVGADERVWYTLVAFDDDGLVSDRAEAIEVTSVGYELTATVRRDGIHLEWNPRQDEGYQGARVFLHGQFGKSELGFFRGSQHLHTEVKPGNRYRFTVVLERADGTAGPSSSPVEITVPKG